jgi:hypothetical protein
MIGRDGNPATLVLLVLFAVSTLFIARYGSAQPAKPPAMTQAQFDQLVKLCNLKNATLEAPATPGADPKISQLHCDPDWDAKMKCADDNFGKNGKIARTSFTSEWICQIAS